MQIALRELERPESRSHVKSLGRHYTAKRSPPRSSNSRRNGKIAALMTDDLGPRRQRHRTAIRGAPDEAGRARQCWHAKASIRLTTVTGNSPGSYRRRMSVPSGPSAARSGTAAFLAPPIYPGCRWVGRDAITRYAHGQKVPGHVTTVHASTALLSRATLGSCSRRFSTPLVLRFSLRR